MRPLQIGDVTITSLVERDGPWRRPEDFFLAYDTAAQAGNVAGLAPEVFDAPSGKMVITYQTFVIRTETHVILVDTCTGEDKGYAAPMDFPKQPWMDALLAAGLTPEAVDYVFCTHLHIDHTGWNTKLVDGKWVPTFPNAK
jgi:glyoxylase-like metal-dependent hydrolase (beta-lactamase superfamily II)